MTIYKPEHSAFQLGEPVEKRKGYLWPGVVVSVFYNLNGEVRYVVECVEPTVKGALHIYNAGDLRKRVPS